MFELFIPFKERIERIDILIFLKSRDPSQILTEICDRHDFIDQLEIVLIIFYNLGIVELFLLWVVIKVKKSDDVLQGISKLDWLLKVSVF